MIFVNVALKVDKGVECVGEKGVGDWVVGVDINGIINNNACQIKKCFTASMTHEFHQLSQRLICSMIDDDRNFEMGENGVSVGMGEGGGRKSESKNGSIIKSVVGGQSKRRC